VVVDERGTVLGLVFLDDALEEIVGPIHDEFDDAEAAAEPALTRLSNKAVDISGAMSYPEARDLLQLPHDSEADTIGGFVIAELKTLPSSGDRLVIGPYRVTVLRVAGRRICRLRFEPTADLPEESGVDVADTIAPAEPGTTPHKPNDRSEA
jgi:CBS domain containing-hemolysin-like protein